MQREAVIQVMATDEEKAFYRKFAQQNGLTISGLVRHAIAMMVQQQESYLRGKTLQGVTDID